eukprot:CAMPEP_0115032512 /NCGR_PEP_ID=MMETSP0216-20121206/39205_1 /TAXON_ID=223996 /ORGANISM="Protocruzia adherens, Strain Boccale" /LENGTH=238 /DNA_ID=CAMNT_0002410431 /DNA_START=92 /DNA_END=809 /DNA_ORIENTATION=-
MSKRGDASILIEEEWKKYMQSDRVPNSKEFPLSDRINLDQLEDYLNGSRDSILNTAKYLNETDIQATTTQNAGDITQEISPEGTTTPIAETLDESTESNSTTTKQKQPRSEISLMIDEELNKLQCDPLGLSNNETLPNGQLRLDNSGHSSSIFNPCGSSSVFGSKISGKGRFGGKRAEDGSIDKILMSEMAGVNGSALKEKRSLMFNMSGISIMSEDLMNLIEASYAEDLKNQRGERP